MTTQPERRPSGSGGRLDEPSSSPRPARGIEPRIRHLRDTYPGGVRSFTRIVCGARRGSFPTPAPETHSMVVYAEVNHGRWIVNCPFCPGAEFADPEDKRFYCLSCGNEDVEGQWLKVKWPQTRNKIEIELLKRSRERNRNWRPGETVKDLIRENVRNGVRR